MGALSKGCGTCKRRKVKCDETRPKCTRCQNAGIDCTGFTRRLKFVDEMPHIRRSATVSHMQSQEFSTMAMNSPIAFHSSRTLQTPSLGLVPSLTNTLPLTAFKDDIFMSYLVSKFFEREPKLPYNPVEESPCGLPKEWATELITTAGSSSRHKSWDALAAIVYGQAYRSYVVVTHATRLYGKALLELHSQLSDPSKKYDDMTMASITALYIYEILVSKTVKGWMLHADGLGGILQWKGPWLQKSYAGKKIFFEHRMTLITKAIMSRQSTFLRSKIWKTVPWEDDPASKSAMDFLVDIGADIAGYLAQIKQYNISKSTKEFQYRQLRAQVPASLEELNNWWRKWESEHAQAAMEVPSSQVNNSSIFPTLLEYNMLQTAFEVCTYDAMRILLLQLWHVLQRIPNPIPSASPGVVLDMPNQKALLGVTSDSEGLACEILRSLNYCYRKSRRFKITSSFLFIQEVAYGYFDQGSKEAKWVATHGWAESVNYDDLEDANLLKTLLPSGKMKLEKLLES